MAESRLLFDIFARDRASQAFKNVGGAADGLGSKLAAVGKVAATALVGAAAGAAAFGVKAVTSASDLAETMSKVGVVFGDQQKIVTGFADQMAADFGTPKREILDAASAIGLIGKASGLSQGDAAKMSTELARLAVDAASFYNVPLPEALDAIKSGLVGEAEPMRRFGVLLNAQAVDAEAARLGLEKVNGAYTEGAKAQARASLIMQGMKDASGDLERTQGSLANRIREVQGRAANFAADVGAKLLPVVLKAFDVFESVGDKLRLLVAVVKDAGFNSMEFADAIDGLLGNTGRFLSVTRAVTAFISDNFIPILAAVGGAVAALVVPPMVAWAAATIAAAAPVVALAAGVAALVGGIVYAYQNFELFRTVVDTVASFITGTVLPVIQQLAGYLMEQLGKAVDWVKSMWPQIQEAIGHVMNVVEGIIRTVTDVIMALWRAWGDDLLRFATAAFGFIRDSIDNALDLVRSVIQTVLAVINGDWSKAWDGIKGVLSAVWDQIKNIVGLAIDAVKLLIGGALSTIGVVWSGAWDQVKGVLAGAWESMKSATSGALDAVVGFVAGLPGRAVSALAGLPGAVLGVARSGFQALTDGAVEKVGELLGFVGGLPGRILDALGDVGGLLRDAGKKLLTGFIDGIKSKIGDIKDTLGGITDKLTSWKGPLDKDRRLLIPAGHAVLAGFVQGLVDMIPAVRSTLTDLTGGLPSTVPRLPVDPVPAFAAAAGGDGVTSGGFPDADVWGRQAARAYAAELQRQGRAS